jgi:hypothetical protein
MMRALMVVVGVVAAAIVLGALWIDEGEVVTLLTTDSDLHVHHTQLWTVELDDTRYLRASTPDVAWLARLREHPVVKLDLGGLRADFRATPVEDPVLRARVNQLMANKYGFADRAWGAWGDREASVPIRLDRLLPNNAQISGRGESP